MTAGRGLGLSAALAIGGALAATLATRMLGLALIDVPPEFPPLSGPGPTIFFTTVSSIVAVIVYAGVRRWSKRPDRLFRVIAAVVLVLSFLPDLWLLGEGAATAFPGATPGGVGLLMMMHVVAAVVIVWALTTGGASAHTAQQ